MKEESLSQHDDFQDNENKKTKEEITQKT